MSRTVYCRYGLSVYHRLSVYSHGIYGLGMFGYVLRVCSHCLAVCSHALRIVMVCVCVVLVWVFLIMVGYYGHGLIVCNQT